MTAANGTAERTEAPDDVLGVHVRITVTGACGHILGTWIDTIEEKYPFFCEDCGVYPAVIGGGRYPWVLVTEIVMEVPGA